MGLNETTEFSGAHWTEAMQVNLMRWQQTRGQTQTGVIVVQVPSNPRGAPHNLRFYFNFEISTCANHINNISKETVHCSWCTVAVYIDDTHPE